MRGRLLLLLAGVGLVAGCATRAPAPRQQPAAPRGTVSIPAPTEPARVATPAAYVARAASYDQLVIRASELLPSAAARSLAEDHRGLAAQLSLAGRRLNLLPQPGLLPNHQQWLDELAAAPTEANYRRLMRRVHQNSYHMHASFAERGSSPTLKMVARNATETERRHYAEITR